MSAIRRLESQSQVRSIAKRLRPTIGRLEEGITAIQPLSVHPFKHALDLKSQRMGFFMSVIRRLESQSQVRSIAKRLRPTIGRLEEGITAIQPLSVHPFKHALDFNSQRMNG